MSKQVTFTFLPDTTPEQQAVAFSNYHSFTDTYPVNGAPGSGGPLYAFGDYVGSYDIKEV